MMPFPQRAGTASSLLGVAQMVCASVSGVIVGQFLGASAWPLAIPLALTGLGTLALWAGSRGARGVSS
jgi:DHA1 family bicyclomycin/chloramphenicol resistance-like MFS transporter